MKYSFIMPVWKGIYLDQALKSILNQDCQDFELIVVDDCSPDNIRDIVFSQNIIRGEKFVDGDSVNDGSSRFLYYRNSENIGGKDLVAQWNHCLSLAHGAYVILATDDDIYDTSFLSAIDKLVGQYPHCHLYRSRVMQVSSDNDIISIDTCYKQYLTKDGFVYHMMHGMHGGIPQYVFKRAVLIDRGGFVNLPLAWGSDDATAIMMSDGGVANTQEPLVRFRWSPYNISSDARLTVEKVRARLMFYHWLRTNLSPVCEKDDITEFLHREVDNYLPTYNKLALIGHIKGKPVGIRLRSLRQVFADDELTCRDKLSIAAHCLI